MQTHFVAHFLFSFAFEICFAVGCRRPIQNGETINGMHIFYHAVCTVCIAFAVSFSSNARSYVWTLVCQWYFHISFHSLLYQFFEIDTASVWLKIFWGGLAYTVSHFACNSNPNKCTNCHFNSISTCAYSKTLQMNCVKDLNKSYTILCVMQNAKKERKKWIEN